MVSGKLAFANAVAAGALAVSFCTSAAAADLTRRPPPPLVAPIPTWAGFYIGGHFGGVTSSETVDFVSTDPSGVLGGLQAGYNYIIAPNWLVRYRGRTILDLGKRHSRRSQERPQMVRHAGRPAGPYDG
jgi:outer membrane immunogenic protein